MSDAAFTPGPWEALAEPGDESMIGIHADPPGCGAVLVRVATIDVPVWTRVLADEMFANAALIAAAPDLYAALWAVVDAVGDTEMDDALAMADAALKKALGKS